MQLLLAGLLLWTLVHLVPSLLSPVKERWVSAFGEKIYKLSFALLVALSIVMMVFGWRDASPMLLYQTPYWFRSISALIMLIAFVLFLASRRPSRIKQHIRHPQLVGFILWAIAHLLVNGDSRSLMLFGWLGAWAVVEIIVINNREGEWKKPPQASWKQEIIGLVVSIAIAVGISMAHEYYAGIAIRL